MADELQLLQLIAKGDKISFKELYALYSNKVYATALHYSQNINDAEEITQDVFVSIFKNANSFKGNAKVSTWVYRIAVNTSLNYIKKKNKRTFFSLEEYNKEIPNFEHPGVVEEKKENARLMYQAINTLPETQKIAFILGFIEEKPRQEIADIMGTSLKAVESLLQRAKTNLKIKLEKTNPHRRKL